MPWETAWSTWRLRRRLVAVTFIGYLPVMLCVAPLMTSLTGSDWAVSATAFGWFGFFITVSVWWMLFPCPRCGKLFSGGWYNNPFNETCRHCGLKAGVQERGDTQNGSRA